jgi:hypothetical protein
MLRFIISLIAVALAGIIQTTPWFQIAGVKPDLVLVLALIFISVLNRDWIERFAIILTAELFLGLTPSPDLYGSIFMGLLIIAALVLDYLRLQPKIGLTITVAVATIILNLSGSWSLQTIILETLYNLVAFIIIYTLTEHLWPNDIRAPKR